MEFNYLVEKKRMLVSLGCIRQTSSACDGMECNKCPLSRCKNGYAMSCTRFEIKYPIEATEIVRKWAKEHPRKTKKDVLLEKFPNTKLNGDGIPCICASLLGLTQKKLSSCNSMEACIECWNTEVEEKKK